MLVPIAAAVAIGFLGWAFRSLKPPAPKICGSPGGPPVTSPRVRLSDGRHLSYREMGVSKEEAKYKIIIIHGFDSSKDIGLPVSQVGTYCVSLEITVAKNFFSIWMGDLYHSLMTYIYTFRSLSRSSGYTFYSSIELGMERVIQTHHELWKVKHLIFKN